MTELTLRDARPEDGAAIEDVTLSAYQEYAPVMQAGWEIYRQNILRTLADVHPAEQIVAERDGRLVGTVLLFPAKRKVDLPDGSQFVFESPEIRLLAVAPAARGQGVGVALMNECMRRAQQAGNAAITLHTTEMMQVAKRMYESMGFVRAPELDFTPAPEFVIMGYRYTIESVP